ncbi:MAG: hypothetical protein R3D56_03875 [Paracoccaceae bacterium]
MKALAHRVWLLQRGPPPDQLDALDLRRFGPAHLGRGYTVRHSGA